MSEVILADASGVELRSILFREYDFEIGDKEKIDIINWSDNASEYIREALSPAEIIKVEIDDKKAKVYDKFSAFINRPCSNFIFVLQVKKYRSRKHPGRYFNLSNYFIIAERGLNRRHLQVFQLP